MTFPLYALDYMGYEAGLVAFTLVGVGFGFVLERAGFGRAPVLTAQFYGTDTRVLKVMFTAIVTALVGMTLLSGVGILDLGAITVPDTYLWPHLVGGILLGVGFVVSGYCPGTSVVAAASGRIDGLLTIGGVMVGTFLFGLVYPWLESFHNSGHLGVLRFTDLLGLPQAVLTAGVLAMAIGAFFVGEWAERFFTRRRNLPAPASAPRTRNGVFAVLGVLTAAGFVGLINPPATPVAPEKTFAAMNTMTFARTLIERGESLYVVDLRDPSACAVKRIPGALCLSEDDPEGAFIRDLPPTRTLVLYSQGDMTEIPATASAFTGEVRVLEGGYAAFNAQFLTTPVAPESGTTVDLARFRVRSAIHGYLTGSRAQPAAPRPKPVKMQRKKKKGGGC
ncbi:MAG: YeeE/YedE family protein [Deltaproteobacteria bacterium]|nr:YeeE/YedE family protein [Deltaproteobacteria bacterium]